MTSGFPSSPPPSLSGPFPSLRPADPLSPSRLLCAGVQHSDLPSPHGGNSSCRSATGSIGPFLKENFWALCRAWPPGPHVVLRVAATTTSYSGGRSSPPSPETAAASSRDAHARGTWHYVAARRAKAKGESRGEEAVARVRASPAQCEAPPPSAGARLLLPPFACSSCWPQTPTWSEPGLTGWSSCR